MNAKKIGFIGLGLIGGSIAKAIRQYYPDYDIIAFDKNKESLALAIQEGTIHTSCSSIDDNFRGCNYIFLCAPVTYNAAYLSQLKDLLDENCILTDVGSVKTSIHEEVIRLGMEANFIGGHPMAGSEPSAKILPIRWSSCTALCIFYVIVTALTATSTSKLSRAHPSS